MAKYEIIRKHSADTHESVVEQGSYLNMARLIKSYVANHSRFSSVQSIEKEAGKWIYTVTCQGFAITYRLQKIPEAQ